MNAEDLFRSAGWHPGRRIDVSADLLEYANRGIDVTPDHEAWLAEFSGLELSTDIGTVWVNGARAAAQIDLSYVESWSTEIGERILPIGGDRHSDFLVTADGAIWSTFGPSFGCLGSTVFHAVDALLSWSPGSPALLNREHSGWPEQKVRIDKATREFREVLAAEKANRDRKRGEGTATEP